MTAKALGVNRKNIYRQSKQEIKDERLKVEIEKTWEAHPAYGHRRLAIYLCVNHKRISRVMRKFNLKPPRRKIKHFCTRSTPHHTFFNLIKGWKPARPHDLWCSDVSYIKFRGRFWYLATIVDIHTRKVVGVQIHKKHDQYLTLSLIKQAMINTKTIPKIFHSDQGTEYMARSVTKFLESNNVKVSVSDTASPWQNGYQESFFGKFKSEFGNFGRFSSVGELMEAIYSYIHYYNHQRIHTSLKMPPAVYEQTLTQMSS